MLATSRAALLLVALLSVSAHVLAVKYDDVQMLCLVNKERKKAGVRPLGLNPKLTKAAYAHSKDQARRRKMSHTGSDGSNPSKRVTRAGYKWKSTAENVAYGYKSMEEVMRSWMRSPGHKRNILDSKSTHFGSGYAMAGSTAYYTQEFASGERVDPASIPRCDGSDYGRQGGRQDYGEDYGNNYGDDYGDDYGRQGGRQDYGENDGQDYGRRGGRQDYGDNYDAPRSGRRPSRDNYDMVAAGDYGSEDYGRQGGRMDYGQDRYGSGRGGDKDCDDDKKGRRGRRGGSDSDY